MTEVKYFNEARISKSRVTTAGVLSQRRPPPPGAPASQAKQYLNNMNIL